MYSGGAYVGGLLWQNFCILDLVQVGLGPRNEFAVNNKILHLPSKKIILWGVFILLL